MGVFAEEGSEMKRGIVGESITNILLWIIFLIIAGVVIFFIIKKLTA